MIGGGGAAALVGFVGGTVIAWSEVKYNAGPGFYYDANGNHVNPGGTGMAGAICLAPFGSLVGAAVGCMYIMGSSRKRSE